MKQKEIEDIVWNKNKKIIKCLFLKDGKCNSDYNKGNVCDGLTSPKDCPYKIKKENEK